MFWTFVDATPALGGSVQIDGKRGHHLARVLRVRPGEHGVAVFAGHEYELEVVAVGGGRIEGRGLAHRAAGGGGGTGGAPPPGRAAQPRLPAPRPGGPRRGPP